MFCTWECSTHFCLGKRWIRALCFDLTMFWLPLAARTFWQLSHTFQGKSMFLNVFLIVHFPFPLYQWHSYHNPSRIILNSTHICSQPEEISSLIQPLFAMTWHVITRVSSDGEWEWSRRLWRVNTHARVRPLLQPSRVKNPSLPWQIPLELPLYCG